MTYSDVALHYWVWRLVFNEVEAIYHAMHIPQRRQARWQVSSVVEGGKRKLIIDYKAMLEEEFEVSCNNSTELGH